MNRAHQPSGRQKRRAAASPIRRWSLAFVAAGLVGALWSSPVHAADNTLSATSPKVNTTVAAAPTSITMRFVNTVGPNPKADVTCGNPAVVYKTGTAVLQPDQHTVVMSIVEPLPLGTCTVIWSVKDAEMQPAGSGSWAFAIAGGAPGPTTTAPSGPTTTAAGGAPTTVAPGTTTSSGGSSQGPLALFRLVSTLGVALVFGGLLAIRLSWPDGVEYKLTHTYLKMVWAVALAGTYLLVGATAAANSGGSIGSALSPAGWTGLIDTAPGKATLLGFLAIAASGWVVLRPERILDPATQLPATVIPFIAVATMGVARDQYTMLDNLLGVLHSLSMAAWLGGAALMARVVLAGSGERDLVHAVRHYSKWAISAMGVTVVTGAAMALSIDGSSFTTSHGMLLVLKTLVGLVMAAMAVMARQGVMARTRPNGAMSTSLSFTLRRVFSLQSLVGLVTLAITTWLLALTPPGVTEASSVSMKLGAAHHFQNLATGVDITLRFSERVGTNDVRIEVMKPATGLTDLEIDFTPPAGSTVNGMAITPIPLTGVGAAILTQDKGFTLSTSGTWTVTARAGGQEVDSTEIYIASGSSNG